jgi:hypothetical protein
MNSARAFLAGIIDYAGLFPPASVDMYLAVAAFAAYRSGDFRDLLGRFVLPAERLDEFASAAGSIISDDAEPWRLSAIASGDYSEVRRAIDRFNDSRCGAVCDTIETRITSPDDVARALAAFPEPFELYLEVPALDDPADLIKMISNTPASAKIRTGGIVDTAVPTSEQIYRFMQRCVTEGVPFKATAGLHHLIRGTYPLTYDVDSPKATMYGFLNIFLAAAFCASGSSESAVIGILMESNVAAFRFDEKGVWWRDHFVVDEQLAVVRQTVATSFGSCSFTEPVGEARQFQLI